MVASVVGALAFALSFIVFSMKASSAKEENEARQMAAIEEMVLAEQGEDITAAKEVVITFMRAVHQLDVDTASELVSEEAKLILGERSKALKGFEEVKRIYRSNPSRMFVISEWYRDEGGYLICRMAQPQRGWGGSHYFVLGIRKNTQEWKILHLDDIRSCLLYTSDAADE